jgi:hypothetical protein
VLQLAIIPALDAIGLGGQAACELVLGTGIQESKLIYRKQLGNGQALGFFQMEPTTFWDIWNRFVEPRRELERQLLPMCEGKPSPKALARYDTFAAAMCRLHYRRFQEPIPQAGDIAGHANYWKKYYNTALGAGRPEQFIKIWGEYMDGLNLLELIPRKATPL